MKDLLGDIVESFQDVIMAQSHWKTTLSRLLGLFLLIPVFAIIFVFYLVAAIIGVFLGLVNWARKNYEEF